MNSINLKNNKHITYYFCVLLYFLTHFLPVLAQTSIPVPSKDYTIDVQQFGLEDGLWHRSVQTVFEDKNGFIWVGTDKGLQRYDGHDFKTWTKADKTGLLYYISAIGQDDAGWLWLWNNDRLQFVFLHPETEEILSVEERFGADFPIHKNNNKQKNWNHGHERLQVDTAGKLYFSLSNGQIITYQSTSGFQSYNTNIEAHHFEIKFIDSQNNIWISADYKYLYKISLENGVLNTYPLQGKANTTQRVSFGNFSEWQQSVYFSTRIENTLSNTTQLTKIDEYGQLHFLQFEEKGIFSIQLGKYWTWTNTGWKIYDWNTKTLLQTLDRKDYDNSLFDGSYSPFTDSKKRVWIYGQLGLNKVLLRPNRFQTYLSFEEDNKPFQNSARGIWVEKDTIVVNLEGSHTIQLDKNQPENWTIFRAETEARPIFKKENGQFLIGYPLALKTLSHSGEIINSYANRLSVGMWSLHEDTRQKLWIGAGEDLLYKEKTDSLLQKHQATTNDFSFGTRRGAIQNMIPETGDLVWFCSWTGLYLFDTKKEMILARFAADEPTERYLPADLFYYIYKDEAGIYWVGTNEGLIRWEFSVDDLHSIQHKIFTRKDGLSNDVIYAIFEDTHQRLWMSSDYGIMSFDKESQAVKTYLPKDGISHHEFNRTSQFQTEDGTIYFGGLNGITAFHPDDFVGDVNTYPKMLISDYEIFDGEEERLINKVGEIRTSHTITFHPNDRFFRLKFVLPAFEDVAKTLYAWKIEGVDKDWNYQKENSLQIGVLPYGQHTLRIKGQSSGGGWSPHELAIQVKVLKPFYLQAWFMILVFLLGVSTIALFFKRRTYLYKKTQRLLETEITKATAQIAADKQTIEIQAEELRQLDKVKSRFFANVSHELRTPLTLMLGPISSALKSGDLSNRNFTLLKQAQQGGKDLLKLVGSILDLSKMESGNMQLHETTVQLFPFIRRIAATFESYAQSQDIRFSFHYQAEKFLQLELDKDKLKIILNNLLSNAIKFTPIGGKVTISVKDSSNHIFIAVTDTGRGIHAEDLPHVFNRFYQSNQLDTPTEGGTGIGLALSQEFIKLMGSTIQVESVLGEGSIFSIQLPRKEILAMASPDTVTEAGKAVTDNAVDTKPNATTTHATTILVVEDNISLQSYLRTILEPYYQIITAENGQVALDILVNQNSNKTKELDTSINIQLVLSDIMMPVMDGYQLMEHVKTHEQLRHLPIIMLTARADIQDKLKALRIGVDDYLLKPFEEEELLVRIKNLLENYKQRLSHDIIKDKNSKPSSKSSISQEDQQWLENVEIYVQQQYSHTHFSIPSLAAEFAMSERSFQRQLKRLTGTSPSKYVQEIRLNTARQLLENHTFNSIAQVAYEVGFKDTKTFSRSFKKRFGKTPSEYTTF